MGTPAAQVPRSAALTPVCSTTPASQPSPSMDRKQQLPLPRCREVLLQHLSAAPHLRGYHLHLWLDTRLQHHTCKASLSIYGKAIVDQHLSKSPYLSKQPIFCIMSCVSMVSLSRL